VAVISSETTHVPITVPPIATSVPLINSVPVITPPAYSISQNENNNEFVDEILNLLTNSQNDGATNNFNDQTLIRQETGINVVRPRERINRTEMLLELEANSRRRAIFEIISRYFTSPNVSYTIVNRLYNLEVGEMITLNALIKIATSRDRPAKASQLQMMDELVASNIFTITQPKRNVVQIRKNNVNN